MRKASRAIPATQRTSSFFGAGWMANPAEINAGRNSGHDLSQPAGPCSGLSTRRAPLAKPGLKRLPACVPAPARVTARLPYRTTLSHERDSALKPSYSFPSPRFSRIRSGRRIAAHCASRLGTHGLLSPYKTRNVTVTIRHGTSVFPHSTHRQRSSISAIDTSEMKR